MIFSFLMARAAKSFMSDINIFSTIPQNNNFLEVYLGDEDIDHIPISIPISQNDQGHGQLKKIKMQRLLNIYVLGQEF